LEGQHLEHKAATAKVKQGQLSHCCPRTVPAASQRREPDHGRRVSRSATSNKDGAEFGYFFLSKKQLKVGSHWLDRTAGGREALSKATPDPRVS